MVTLSKLLNVGMPVPSRYPLHSGNPRAVAVRTGLNVRNWGDQHLHRFSGILSTMERTDELLDCLEGYAWTSISKDEVFEDERGTDLLNNLRRLNDNVKNYVSLVISGIQDLLNGMFFTSMFVDWMIRHDLLRQQKDFFFIFLNGGVKRMKIG